jgi:hypothetical protein
MSTIFTTLHEKFIPELDCAFVAALQHCPWQHIDDTGTRLDGVGYYCHIVTSPLGCFYFTRPSKSRLTIIEVLRNETSGHFRLDEDALDWMLETGVPASTCEALSGYVSEASLPEALFRSLLDEAAPWLKEPLEQRDSVTQKVWEAAALSDYHRQKVIPVVRLLVSDDALQFKGITTEQILCWIHRGRNIKKLTPQVSSFRKEQEQALGQFWGLYRQLMKWKMQPDDEMVPELKAAFDALAACSVDYVALAEQLKGLADDREYLLLAPLRHPEVLLHNNPAELDARGRARKRDISFGPRTVAGAKAWDTWQSLLGTVRKLGLNAYQYVRDRLTEEGRIPPLEQLIAQKAEELKLGWTWGLRDAPGG